MNLATKRKLLKISVLAALFGLAAYKHHKEKQIIFKVLVLLALLGVGMFFAYKHFAMPSVSSTKISFAKEGQEPWTGPGFYYGFWFGSVGAYNKWWAEDHHGQVYAKNSKKQKSNASTLASRHAYRAN